MEARSFGDRQLSTSQISTSMEAISKLDDFVSTLSYANDLFPSKQNLLVYSFGKRSILDMFTCAMGCSENMNKCKEISKVICDAAADAVGSATTANMSSKENVSEQLSFFWEVYRIKDIPDLLNANELSTLEGLLGKINRLINQNGIDQVTLRSLPLAFRVCLGIEPATSADKSAREEMPLFLKDISNHNYLLENMEERTPPDSFAHQLEQELDRIATGSSNLDCLRGFSEIKLEEMLPSKYAKRLVNRLISAFDKNEFSTDVGAALFTLLEKVFYLLADDAKTVEMRSIYDKFMSEDGHLPLLEKYLQDPSTGITQCINQIGDHVDIQNDATKFESIRNKLSWYLLVVPRLTLARLLTQCLENKLIVPGVISILRSCSATSVVLIKSEKLCSKNVPFLIDIVNNIFQADAQRWAMVEQQDRLVYLLTSLCRRRRALSGKSENATLVTMSPKGAEASILSGEKVLRLFVMPNLMRRTHEILMLKILHRFMQTVGAKEVHLQWAKNVGENTANTVQAPELLLLILELFMEYESKHHQGAEICRNILKSFAEKLRGDDIIFGKDTIDFVLFSLRRYHWWIRYAVCCWFSYTLSDPVQQLPAGLYKSLALDQQEKYEQISVDFSFSPTECFFRSFFELALFDTDLAAEFLRRGISLYPRDENIVEKIAVALVESCEHTGMKQSIACLAPLLQELVRVLDPSQEMRFMELLCESTYHGLRLIQHLLLLGAAVKIAYYKSSDKVLNNCPHVSEPVNDITHVAADLLQGFCELSKAQAEKEVINLRRSRLPFPPEIKEDYLPPPQITIRRDERVYAQLAALFNVACSLTKLVAQPPLALQVLINCLCELLLEVQGMRLGKCLDDSPSDTFQSNTVYAFAQLSQTKKRAESLQSTAANSKQGDNLDNGNMPRGNEMCCVENELFNPNVSRMRGSIETLATARQITGMNMRKNAEKRLISREGPVNTVNASATLEHDNSGKSSKKKRGTKRR